MLFLFIFSFFSIAYADVPISDPISLKAEGFLQVLHVERKAALDLLPETHSLSWPIEFENRENTMGNSMIQYQPFGDPYFHGGCDLRVSAHGEVHSPVSGKLEAGHYSYTKNNDGSLNKYWKPWPAFGSSMYFEVAVIDQNNIRYEFHHVDRDALPREIIDKLNSENPTVQKGDLLGQAIEWPSLGYHHIHYNIILPDGTRVNPEYLSPLIVDHTPPEAKLFAKRKNQYEEIRAQELVQTTTEFAILTSDKKDFNSYEQPPVIASLTLESGKSFRWDFQKFLLHDRAFPNLWSYLIPRITTTNNTYYSTDGGYGEGKSIIRLPVPENTMGKFLVELEDNSGNKTSFSGTFR